MGAARTPMGAFKARRFGRPRADRGEAVGKRTDDVEAPFCDDVDFSKNVAKQFLKEKKSLHRLSLKSKFLYSACLILFHCHVLNLPCTERDDVVGSGRRWYS